MKFSDQNRYNRLFGRVIHKRGESTINYIQIFHQILGHRSKRLLLYGDTENVWQDIKLRVDPYPFCTSYKISTVNKKARSKKPLNPQKPFK